MKLTPTMKEQRSFRGDALRTALAVSLSLVCGGVAADKGDSPTQLRQFIDQQVGGIAKLMVPATNADIPVPRQPDGTVAYRFQTTEAKRYLGKLLFHDPVRTARININTGQPLDLPAGTAFGGTMDLEGNEPGECHDPKEFRHYGPMQNRSHVSLSILPPACRTKMS